jgi:small subunit ribosomal protein S1
MTMNAPKDESFASMFEAAPKVGFARRVRTGDVLDLEVVRVGTESVLVALDGKQEGVIPLSELSRDDGTPTVRVGSRVAARVVDIDRSTGEVRLSPVSADPIVQSSANATPAASQQATSRGTPIVVGMRVKGKVAGVERYGVFVEFAIAGAQRPERGLVPTAELGKPRGADLRKAFPIGTDIEAAVIAVDEKGRVRLSVIALTAAEERSAFENYNASKPENTEKAEGGKGARREGFGTLADLLKQRK